MLRNHDCSFPYAASFFFLIYRFNPVPKWILYKRRVVRGRIILPESRLAIAQHPFFDCHLVEPSNLFSCVGDEGEMVPTVRLSSVFFCPKYLEFRFSILCFPEPDATGQFQDFYDAQCGEQFGVSCHYGLHLISKAMDA